MSLRTAIDAVAAALSAWALYLVAPHATPIDRALPVTGVIIIAVSLLAPRWTAAIQMAVPLLAAAAITLPDDQPRLLAYGLITALAFTAALLGAGPLDRPRAVAFTLAALVLLRWLPPGRVGREVLVLISAVMIVLAFRRVSALAVVFAVTIALITPAFPLRTFALPILVAIIIFLATRQPITDNRQPSTLLPALALALILTFYPWSGIVARAVPLLPLLAQQPAPRAVVAMALAPGEHATLDVPPDARSLVVFASNASRMRRGELLAVVIPSEVEGPSIPIRIGDCADWGALRRDHFYKSRNPLPRDPAGMLRAYGYAAWIDGAGRIALPAGAKSITVRVEPKLADVVRLEIVGFELGGR